MAKTKTAHDKAIEMIWDWPFARRLALGRFLTAIYEPRTPALSTQDKEMLAQKELKLFKESFYKKAGVNP